MSRAASSATQQVRSQIAALRDSGELDTGIKTQPRCYVCCEAESKNLVNRLLAAGLTNREITEACASINARRQQREDCRIINQRSVWMHRREHFGIDLPVQAAYRAILERRAAEANRDVEEGIGSAVTPLAVMETTMVKGYAAITDEQNAVTVKETLDAARHLHDITNRDAGQKRMADLLYTMDRIVKAAQEFVPEDKQDAFLARVRGRVDQSLGELIDSPQAPAIREFTPNASTDENDTF